MFGRGRRGPLLLAFQERSAESGDRSPPPVRRWRVRVEAAGFGSDRSFQAEQGECGGPWEPQFFQSLHGVKVFLWELGVGGGGCPNYGKAFFFWRARSFLKKGGRQCGKGEFNVNSGGFVSPLGAPIRSEAKGV